MLKSILFQIRYIFSFKSTFFYKVWYAYSLFFKFIRQVFAGEYHFSKFPFPWEFLIENDMGKFYISEPSDMHSILNPNFENDIYPFFTEIMGKWIFLDIGANVGKFSVMVGKNTELTPFAFEPNPKVRRFLQMNLLLNNVEGWKIIEYGISDEKGFFEFSVPGNNFGSWSLVFTETNELEERIRIETAPLDDYVIGNGINASDVRLIKIDVEWLEENVLRWGFETLCGTKACTLIVESFENDFLEKSQSARIIADAGYVFVTKTSGDNYIFKKSN